MVEKWWAYSGDRILYLFVICHSFMYFKSFVRWLSRSVLSGSALVLYANFMIAGVSTVFNYFHIHREVEWPAFILPNDCFPCANPVVSLHQLQSSLWYTWDYITTYHNAITGAVTAIHLGPCGYRDVLGTRVTHDTDEWSRLRDRWERVRLVDRWGKGVNPLYECPWLYVGQFIEHCMIMWNNDRRTSGHSSW